MCRFVISFYHAVREEGSGRGDAQSRLSKENVAKEGGVKNGMTGGEEGGIMDVATDDQSGRKERTDLSLCHVGDVFSHLLLIDVRSGGKKCSRQIIVSAMTIFH